jgi:hypothetical protein
VTLPPDPQSNKVLQRSAGAANTVAPGDMFATLDGTAAPAQDAAAAGSSPVRATATSRLPSGRVTLAAATTPNIRAAPRAATPSSSPSPPARLIARVVSASVASRPASRSARCRAR